MILTWEQIESYRDFTYCRTPVRQVRDIQAALEFVTEVGFCFAFTARRSELPCLWHAACGERHPVYPEHTHSDPYIGLVWRAKDVLPAQGVLYYGKAIKQRPSMISLAFLPAFYRLIADNRAEDSHIADYMAGSLSSAGRQIMDVMMDRSPLVTAELKLASGFANPRKRAEFDRGMAELQMRMYICKIAEFYDPFTFLWERFNSRFAGQVAEAATLSAEHARERILLNYFTIAGVATLLDIQRLFGWRLGEVEQSVESLLGQGFLSQVRIQGEKKSYYMKASSKLGLDAAGAVSENKS